MVSRMMPSIMRGLHKRLGCLGFSQRIAKADCGERELGIQTFITTPAPHDCQPVGHLGAGIRQQNRCLTYSGRTRMMEMVDISVSEDYDCYRRAANGGISHKALLVDAAGTLIVPSQPSASVYRDIGKKYGVKYSTEEVLARYRWAFSQPWIGSRLRYVNDGRTFWQFIVEQATGCSDKDYFEELYQYYSTAEAWHVTDPEAERIFKALRNAGMKIAVVSNFDTRLRPLMRDLNCAHWFDAVAVSAEVEAEKPNPTIFLHACELLGVRAEDAVHVGDDRRNDIWGARDAGCDAWLWGADVHTFREVAERIGVDVA